MVLDRRHLSCPACFDGTQERSFDEWRFELVALTAVVDPRFGDVADEARSTTSYAPTDLPPDEEGRKPCHALRSSCKLHHEQTSALDHGDNEP